MGAHGAWKLRRAVHNAHLAVAEVLRAARDMDSLGTLIADGALVAAVEEAVGALK